MKHYSIQTNRFLTLSLLLLQRCRTKVIAAATTTTGESPECPCVDRSDILSKHSNCLLPNSTQSGVLIEEACYPFSYGSNECLAHDILWDPACNPDNAHTNPKYCLERFCYVDYEKCSKSEEDFYKSSFFRDDDNEDDIFYSYSTCGSSADAWLDYDTTKVFAENQTIRAVVASIFWPVHYKINPMTGDLPEDTSGDEYFNNSIPWEGWIFDYMDEVRRISNLPPLTYVHRTKGSIKKSSSKYTQAITDIAAGLSDTSFSTFWVTPERLAITPFTVPVFIDTFKLWIPQPEVQENSFADNAKKLLLPFSTGLWLAVIGTTIIFAIMSAHISPRDYQQESDQGSRQESLSPKNRFLMRRIYEKTVGKLAAKKVANAFTGSFLDLLGGSVSYNVESSAAQKLMNFGFALFVFVVVTAYTANLTAFLTLSGTSNYLSSIEEATVNKAPLCAPFGVEDDLRRMYPDIHWVFEPNTNRMVESFKNGKCKALVTGWVDIRSSPFTQQVLCDHNLVRVGYPIMEKPVAFPASKEIVAGLSHWIAVAESQGTTFKDFLYSSESRCNLEIVVDNSDFDELQEMALVNLALPFFVFGLCAVLAFAKHQHKKVNEKTTLTSNKRLDTGRPESNGADPEDARWHGFGNYAANVECAPDTPTATRSLDEAIDELFFGQQRLLLGKVKEMIRQDGIQLEETNQEIALDAKSK